jgi:cytochrome P450
MEARMVEVPESGIALADAPVHSDRTKAWEYVRSGGDVFESGGIWHITGADALTFALQHPELFSNSFGSEVQGGQVVGIPQAVDPPEHSRYRRVINPMFAPRAVSRMENELRRQLVELIEKFASTGSCEVMADLARDFPTQVFLTMFGLPLSDRDKLVGWVTANLGSGSSERAAALYHGEMPSADPDADPTQDPALLLLEYLRGKIEEKRVNPGDDVLSHVLRAAEQGEQPWTPNEVLGLASNVVQAGLDTVTASIGFLFYHLATKPDLRNKLLEDPGLVPAAIEEILRLEMVAPFVARVTKTDVEIGGKTIPADSLVWIAYAAANRDPRRFPNADEINLGEDRVEHFSFGGGIHRCLGSHLARLELRLVFEEFHKRIPHYELAPGADPSVEWPALIYNLDSVPLVFPVS